MWPSSQNQQKEIPPCCGCRRLIKAPQIGMTTSRSAVQNKDPYRRLYNYFHSLIVHLPTKVIFRPPTAPRRSTLVVISAGGQADSMKGSGFPNKHNSRRISLYADLIDHPIKSLERWCDSELSHNHLIRLFSCGPSQGPFAVILKLSGLEVE